MTGPIIPADQWPDTVVAKLWTSAGACWDLAPFAGGWGLGVSSTPMPAGHDWRVPVMRPTVKDSLTAPPAIDLEQFRCHLNRSRRWLITCTDNAGGAAIAREVADADRLLALIDGQGSSCALPAASAKALHEAVAAIYFNDSSDYLSALWQVVRILDPSVAHLLERDESAAYDQTASALEPTKGEGVADD